MKIVIVGYGRMGKEVERQAKNFGFEVSQIAANAQQLDSLSVSAEEVVIEFSKPNTALKNLKHLLAQGAKVVCGTTGWCEQLAELEPFFKKSEAALLYSANFSLGVQLFWRLAKEAAQLFDAFEHYDILLNEAHHRHKLDAPSGTAIRTAEIVLEQLQRKQSWRNDLSGNQLKENELHIGVSRGGSEAGRHELIFDSQEERISLCHQAKSRAVFASGALRVAKWLSKRCGFYTVDDYLQEHLDRGREG